MAPVTKNWNTLYSSSTCLLILGIMVLQQISTVQGPSSSMLPFCVKFPAALRSGQVIKIMGSVKEATNLRTPPWLNVVLLAKCNFPDSPFFLKIRFDQRKLIRNNFNNRNWGAEERDGEFPFSLGTSFLLLIEVQPDGFQVTANGVRLWTFPNRMISTEVEYLQVSGDSASIQRVELIDLSNKEHPGKGDIIYPYPLGPTRIVHPSFPFWGYFPGGLQAGKAIRITGIFAMRTERTTFNLCADCFKGPIMLHLDLRFRFGTDVNRAVRNIYINGDWGNYEYEERDGPFPFHIREPFTMLIAVTPESYNISVDGIPCWTFKHRLPYTQVTSMTIERGLMTIWDISYIDQDTDNAEAETSVTAPAPAAMTSSSTSLVLQTLYYTLLSCSLAWIMQLI